MSFFYKTSKIKKLCLILIFVLTLSSIGLFSQPKEVKAAPAIYVPVVDYSNLAVNTMIEYHEAGLWWKEYVIDPAVWEFVDELIRNILIDPILDYIGEGFWNELHWMDAGFSANIPAFIQDTIGYRIDLGDLTAAATIEEIILGGICGTFPDGIRDGMRAAVEDTFRLFPSPTRRDWDWRKFACDTLGAYVPDYDVFVRDGNFFEGGWDGFFSLTQNESHNPYGMYFNFVDEVAQKRDAEEQRLMDELGYGDGFLSARSSAGDNPIITPGSVIAERTMHVMGGELRRWEQADEVSEFLALIFGVIFREMLGDGNVGLTSHDPTRRTGTSTPPVDRTESTLECVVDHGAGSLTLSWSYTTGYNARILRGTDAILTALPLSGSHTEDGYSPGETVTFFLQVHPTPTTAIYTTVASAVCSFEPEIPVIPLPPPPVAQYTLNCQGPTEWDPVANLYVVTFFYNIVNHPYATEGDVFITVEGSATNLRFSEDPTSATQWGVFSEYIPVGEPFVTGRMGTATNPTAYRTQDCPSAWGAGP